jgi:ABC-2 type transport system ATP-binding protein
MSHAIDIQSLYHRFRNGRTVYEDLTFSVQAGSVCGLLGKNGQGKTTLVNILMGFLQPTGGHCRVLGHDSHALTPAVRNRIGLLHEGHLAYEFMTIGQTERFFRGCYPHWRPDIFHGLVDKMGLSCKHKVGRLSCGQRSQVVLGVIMAQDPDLLILDDYTMGLDAGYRRLFLEVLHDFKGRNGKTIFVTSHIVQDLEQLVDSLIFLDQGKITQVGLETFMTRFGKYLLQTDGVPNIDKDHVIQGVERRGRQLSLYSYADRDALAGHLARMGVDARDLRRVPMSLEDGFVGLMGKY